MSNYSRPFRLIISVAIITNFVVLYLQLSHWLREGIVNWLGMANTISLIAMMASGVFDSQRLTKIILGLIVIVVSLANCYKNWLPEYGNVFFN
jgi:hypothetical protein